MSLLDPLEDLALRAPTSLVLGVLGCALGVLAAILVLTRQGGRFGLFAGVLAITIGAATSVLGVAESTRVTGALAELRASYPTMSLSWENERKNAVQLTTDAQYQARSAAAMSLGGVGLGMIAVALSLVARRRPSEALAGGGMIAIGVGAVVIALVKGTGDARPAARDETDELLLRWTTSQLAAGNDPCPMLEQAVASIGATKVKAAIPDLDVKAASCIDTYIARIKAGATPPTQAGGPMVVSPASGLFPAEPEPPVSPGPMSPAVGLSGPQLAHGRWVLIHDREKVDPAIHALLVAERDPLAPSSQRIRLGYVRQSPLALDEMARTKVSDALAELGDPQDAAALQHPSPTAPSRPSAAGSSGATSATPVATAALPDSSASPGVPEGDKILEIPGQSSIRLHVDAVINGPLDAGAFRQKLVSMNDAFQQCYAAASEKKPGLVGKLAVKFLIGTDGAIGNLLDGGTSFTDSKLVRCLLKPFKTLTFSPPGALVSVVVPIEFSAATP